MDVKDRLRQLTGKKYIFFVKRGNQAIDLALKLARETSDKLMIQDQGGWLHYKRAANKLKFEVQELKTNYGEIVPNSLQEYSVLLVNSMPAYAWYQDTKFLEKECKQKNILMINDISGSIGISKEGDILLASFGQHKPLEIGNGAMIATNEDLNLNDYVLDEEELNEQLDQLDNKREFFHALKARIEQDLSEFGVIKPNKKGFNVIVRYKNEDEHSKILQYCAKHQLESTECPRYIRVLENAVSIEVKRKWV